MPRRHRHSHRCLQVIRGRMYCTVMHDEVVVPGEEPEPEAYVPRARYRVTMILPNGKPYMMAADTLQIAEDTARNLLAGGAAKLATILDLEAGTIASYSRNPGRGPWRKLPKGWTEASLQSMAAKLLSPSRAGAVPHPISECVERIGASRTGRPHIQTPEAFCATLARRTERDRR